MKGNIQISRSLKPKLKTERCRRCYTPIEEKYGYCESCMTRICETIESKIPRKYLGMYNLYFEKILQLRNKSLFITGKTGSGKTGLSFGIMQSELFDGKSCKYICYPEYIDGLRNFQNDGMRTAHYEKMKIANYEGILILDDVGAETLSEFDRETLYIIVNARYIYNRRTIITSNMSLNQVGEMDDRIASRIAEMYEIVDDANLSAS